MTVSINECIKCWPTGRIEKETTTKYQQGNSQRFDEDQHSNIRSTVCKNDNGSLTTGSSQIPTTGSSNRSQFEREALEAHNKYRRKHNVSDLVLCPKLTNFAQEWAEHLASTDSFQHRVSGPYGENLFCSWGFNSDCNGIEPIDSWYSENQMYNYAAGSSGSGTGHFTQVIWKGSQKLGIGRAKSKSGKNIVVANYDPPGNFIGQYRQNVLPPSY